MDMAILDCTTDERLTRDHNTAATLLSVQPDININVQLSKLFLRFVAPYVAIVTTGAVQSHHHCGGYSGDIEG